MLRFLAYRLLSAIPVLFIMTVITFVIIHSTPGDYADYVGMQLKVQGGSTNSGGPALVVDPGALIVRRPALLMDPGALLVRPGEPPPLLVAHRTKSGGLH